MNITTVPAPRVPVVDPQTGLVAPEWYRWFINVFTLVGAGRSDVTLPALEDSTTEQQFMLMGA